MLERVVENWLTKANERSFEIPFAQLLTGEGHQVLHLSRHGPFEEGKDILAIAPDGIPCAYQLKGTQNGKITQTYWAKECSDQINRLVEIPIVHPSINPQSPRRVYFVTNGELDEEVRVEIAHKNLDSERRGLPQLETIVKGQLLTRFKNLHSDLWPIELVSERNLLELFLVDGSNYLNKEKLSQFLISMLPIYEEEINLTKCSRILASMALLTVYALSSYEEKSNHIAIIEGWTIYIACLTALVEKFNIGENYWKDSLDIASYAIEKSLNHLCDELRQRDQFIEGEPLVDAPFYKGRITWLSSFVSAYVLWNRLRDPKFKIDNWYFLFIEKHLKELHLWGEAAIPQFLAIYWFLRHTKASLDPDFFLANLIDIICINNGDKNSRGLPDPYHEFADVIIEQFGLRETPNSEIYSGRSYTMETLVQLFVRRCFRRKLQVLWPNITHLDYAEYITNNVWEFCLWRTDNGKLIITQPKKPQSWSELIKDARCVDKTQIPIVFKTYPELLLFFILVFPHRLTKNAAKFIDDCLREVRLLHQSLI
jgi:hypothetical protein